MGSRANYIIIEGGSVAVYYAHWGAQSVPSAVIGGPAETSAFIRGLKPYNTLMNTAWAEGGILLDADTCTLVLWGGESISFRPYLWRPLLGVLRVIWPGWSVSWATRGIVDFAEYPGVARALDIDPASVISVIDADASSSYYAFPEAEIRASHERAEINTAITVKWDDVRVADYTFDHVLPGYLIFGSALLNILRERAPDALPREDGDRRHDLIGGAYVDVAARILWVWEEITLEAPYLQRIEQAWPGWRVEWHLDGLAHQVALSGRDPTPVLPPSTQRIAELLRELMNGDSALEPSPHIATAERREWLLQLVRQVVEGETHAGANQ